MSYVVVRQLSVNYDETPVLWDINLEVESGHMVGIVGPNGAGKSTFIKALLGLVTPLAGQVEFFGKPLKKVRKQVAYVPQRESVDWDFPITVRDLILMGRYGELGILRWPRRADYFAVERALESVGMTPYADRQIGQLSGGQQQRVFLARALVQDADVIFLDEPFAGVDLATETVIVQLLKQLAQQGKTVFVVHHDLNTVENYFDWVILLNMRLIGSGPTKQVFNPEALYQTYGKSYSLLDEALKVSKHQVSGLSD